jgi:hypothetical protein
VSPNSASSRRTSQEEEDSDSDVEVFLEESEEEADFNPRVNKRRRQNNNSNNKKDDGSYNSESDEDYTPLSRRRGPGLFQPFPSSDRSANGPNGTNTTSVNTNPSSASNNNNNNNNSYDWIPKFHDFLINVPHGRNSKTVSAANARSVVRQVEKMVNGLGITYQHWPSGIVFARGETFNYRTTDLEALHRRAKGWELRYGRDKGNGWLLQHPIQKLQIYKEYLKKKNNS